MDYYKFKIKNEAAHTEALIALFGLSPFDMFQETDTGFDAFIPANLYSESILSELNEINSRIGFSYEKEFIKGQNWNAIWESNFHPVQVEDFCGVRASFHPPFGQVEHELVINPKMAFGTGHHETTYSVIKLMRGMDFSGQSVFDYGCGTGILSILASRLGAASVLAVDIEKESYLNTIENCEKNGAENVRPVHGTLKDVPADRYGIVLANINRNVILNSLETLASLIPAGGLLVISGFVLADKNILEFELEKYNFQPLETLEKGNWLAMKCQRN